MRTLEETIEVYVGEDGNIYLSHVDMSEDCYLAVAPDQTDLLISWLKQKKTEAIKYRRKLAAAS